MSDNRTADIPSYTLIDMHGDIHDVVYLEDAYKLSQQTASLREENEKLHGMWSASERIRMSDAQSAIREANSLRGRIEQLQEEVERLRSVIEQIKKGVGQLSDEAKNILSPDGRFGQRAEDRNHGIESGAKLILTMISLIEDKALSSKESKPS